MAFLDNIKSKFSKTDSNQDGNSGINGVPESIPGKPKRIQKFKMQEVFRESVKEYALGEMAKNDPFIAKYDGQKCYGALLYKVGQVGLLDKTNKNNEAIGSFIEVVNGGSIKVYITEEMYLHEEILLIPDKDTFYRMNEYGFLRNAEFDLVFVMGDELLDVEKKITLANVKEIFDMGTTISGFLNVKDLKELDSEEHQKEESVVSEVSDFVPEIKDVDEEVSDHVELVDNSLINEDEWVEEDELAFEDEIVDEESTEEDKEVKSTVATDEQRVKEMDAYLRSEYGDALVEQAYQTLPDDGEVNQEQLEEILEQLQKKASEKEKADNEDVTDEDIEVISKKSKEVQELEEDEEEEPFELDVEFEDASKVFEDVKKVFHSDDISLEISDYQFLTEVLSVYQPKLLDENRQEGLLNNEINEKCKIINHEMKTVFTDHIKQLHERYNLLLDESFDDIVAQIDYKDENSKWYEDYKVLNEKKEADMAQMPEQVDIVFERYETDYLTKKEEYAKNAYAKAELEFDKEHGLTKDIIQNRIEQAYISKVDVKYTEEFDKLYKERKRIAQEKIDIAISHIINEEIKPMFEQFKKEEEELFKVRSAEIEAFLDNHRKDEMARMQIVEKEMEENNKADVVRKGFLKEIDNMKSDFEKQIEQIKNDYENLKMSKEFLEQVKDREFATQVALSSGELEKAQIIITDLRKEIVNEKKNATKVIQEATERSEKIAREFELKYEKEKAKNKATKTAITVFVAFIMFIVLVVAGYVLLYSFSSANQHNGIISDLVYFDIDLSYFYKLLC